MRVAIADLEVFPAICVVRTLTSSPRGPAHRLPRAGQVDTSGVSANIMTYIINTYVDSDVRLSDRDYDGFKYRRKWVVFSLILRP